VRAGTPVGEQIAPRAAAAKRKARRLHATAATPAQGAWAQQPEVQDTNLELQQQLERELKVKLHTGQHASSALAGVKVEGMKHKHVVQDAGEGGHDMGHQM
jgi:N-acetylmuramoyl-L-alanine amidase